MFFRWEKIIKIKKINRILESGKFASVINDELAKITVSLKKFTTKTVKAPNIDEREEYLNINDNINQVNINNKPSWIDKAVIIPKYVATPFPPLNFNHNGKRWPRKANIHDNSINSGKYCAVIIIGMYPFNTSKINVRIAKYLLPVLRTFVAPMLPDPILLISFLINNFVKINPNGIDPNV